MCDTLGHELHRLIGIAGMRSVGALSGIPEEGDDIAGNLVDVPEDGGLYFFLDEFPCRQEANLRRIARVGKAENVHERLLWHLSSDQSLWYRQGKVRSVFRQHIGRCLFVGDEDRLQAWNASGQPGAYHFEGDIARMEREVSAYLRSKERRFLWIVGRDLIPMEHSLIGCLSRCSCNRPPAAWLGSRHPNETIRNVGLWNVKGISHACPTTPLQAAWNRASDDQPRAIPQPTTLCAQAIHLIPFRRASFYPAIHAALQGFSAQHGGSFPVGGAVEVSFTPKGFSGEVRASITQDPTGFLCNLADQDNWFPARIKNAPAALYDLGLFGCYEISHDRGIGQVTIVRLA